MGGATCAKLDAILHLATLHKPHVATHSRQDFVDVNVNGTLILLGAPIQWMNKASKRCGYFVTRQGEIIALVAKPKTRPRLVGNVLSLHF